MKAIVPVLALALVAGCADTPPQTPAQQAQSQRIFDYVMEQVPAYLDERNAKAMAACITWHDDGKQPRVVRVRWYRVGQTSDALIPAGQLMNSAMLVCEREIAGTEGCTCHELALNDVNVLKIP